MIRARALLVALSLATVPTIVRAAQPPTAIDDAQAAIDRGKAAARAGDHATALREFESALAQRPSARLRFNVAVCHHQLMLGSAKDSAAHEQHRQGAVAAYRAYLQETPDAEDRDEVERIIVELGGEPPARPGMRLPRVHPDDEPAAPQLQDVGMPRVEPTPTTTPATTSTTTPPPTKPRELRARVGPFVPLVLAHMGQLKRSDAREDEARAAFAPMIGLGARGAGFLGAHKRVHVGGEAALYVQPVDTRQRHTLFAAHLAFTTDYALVLGPARRFELTFGGLLGVLYEQLRVRDAVDGTRCAKHATGEVSARGGLLFGGRIGLVGLLGARRNHEIGLRFGPALSVVGRGTQRDDCDDEPPFQEVGLPSGAGLVTMIDLGYAPRF